nr:MAG: hypothetical protein DIU61_12890 [Bacteroidota bacterium]
MKPKVVLYESFEEKKSIAEEPVRLTDQEAFARVLDLLDFNAALSAQNENPVVRNDDLDNIQWIELKWHE